jgi:hypothetical protein
MSRLVVTICVGLIGLAFAEPGQEDFPTDLGKWVTLDPPGPSSDEWLVANNDFKHEWVVTLRDGRPVAHLRGKETPAPLPFEIAPGTAREGLSGWRYSIKVSDGWIVAFNAGEFGAGLWWFSPDGKKRDKISEAWINDFIETKSGLLALEGIAHGVGSEGQILQLIRSPTGRWRAEVFVNLKHAPDVGVKQTDGSLIVATTHRLLRVVPADKKVEVVLDDAFWGGLYPNSIAVTQDGTIYLGMSHGIAKLERKSGKSKVTWLLPNQRFANMKSEKGFK